MPKPATAGSISRGNRGLASDAQWWSGIAVVAIGPPDHYREATPRKWVRTV